MSKNLKIYNPFDLEIEKDKPTFESDKSKWWLVHISKSNRYSIYRALQKENKQQDYVVIDTITNDIETYSKSLEHCLVEIDMLEAYDRLGK